MSGRASTGPPALPAGCSRAALIADAAIRVIARRGLDALSVRNAAAEAAVSAGTVQHHFATRDLLLVAALERVVARQSDRAAGAAPARTTIGTLVRTLATLLPSDDDSRDDAVVWVAMSAAAAREPVIATLRREVVDRTQRHIAAVLERARHGGELAADVDVARAAARIEAVVDGLLLHAITAPAGPVRAMAGELAALVSAILAADATR